jgi:hypothetical protein
MDKRRYTLSGDDVRLMKQAIRRVNGGKGSARPVPTRRRNRGGGAAGDAFVYGRLIAEVPADSTLQDAIELETFEGWFTPVLDESDNPVLAHAGNPSLYSAYRGSESDPVRVWGVMRTAEVSVDSVLTDVSTFIIHGEFKDQIAAAHGFVQAPDNDKGQALIHNDGSRATVVDGGPCGGA